jgi:NADH:ubiquinone oxidoreductase subunit F (NADH-binding)
MTGLRVGPAPDVSPRLIRAGERRESLAEYREAGGYRDLPDGAALLDLVEACGLRGRGGASFPTGRKIRAVREGAGRAVVLANGEEGEPSSVKDRWLLRTRPHLVLDGVLHAAAAVDADVAHVYVSDPEAERSVLDALAELGEQPVDLRVTRVEPSYVAGEETAAVNALNGRPALPSDKPPRPFESGVDGRPTLVSNVETLANLPVLARLGADGYRSVGTDRAPGTFLMTLGGRVNTPGLYELPLGVPLGVAIDGLGGVPESASAFLLGGYFGGLLGERGLSVPLDYDAMLAEGVGLGCGGVTVLGPQDCPVRVAAEVMAYFARENAAQCGSCFNGTAAMSGVLTGLVEGPEYGSVGDDDLANLRRWSVFLKGRGACGTLDGAAQLAASLLREFPELVGTHLDGSCPTCRAAGPIGTAAPFAVDPPALRAELLGS